MLYEEKTIYIPHGPLALPYLLLIVHLGKDISIMASDLPKERAGISKLTRINHYKKQTLQLSFDMGADEE